MCVCVCMCVGTCVVHVNRDTGRHSSTLLWRCKIPDQRSSAFVYWGTVNQWELAACRAGTWKWFNSQSVMSLSVDNKAGQENIRSTSGIQYIRTDCCMRFNALHPKVCEPPASPPLLESSHRSSQSLSISDISIRLLLFKLCLLD